MALKESNICLQQKAKVKLQFLFQFYFLLVVMF